MVAGMLWWQYRQFYVSLDETDAAAAEALDARARGATGAAGRARRTPTTTSTTLRQSNASLGERLDTLPGRFVALEERLDAVQGGSFDARGDLLRSEAEYYLTVANTELTLTRRLRERGDGARARRQPARRDRRIPSSRRCAKRSRASCSRCAACVCPTSRASSSASAGSRRAPTSCRCAPTCRRTSRAKPMKSSTPSPASGGLWLAIKGTLLDLVRIERRDEPVPQALSAAERALEPPAARGRARARAHRRAARRRASVLERARDGDRDPAARLRRRGRPTSKARSRCSASCAASTSIPSAPTSAAR